MIVVTGAAGFIGSNIARALNASGRDDIVAVDDLEDGRKFHNLADLSLADYWDRDDCLARLRDLQPGNEPQAVIHQGACSDTTEWDGRYMMRNNFEYSKQLLHYCLERQVPLVYASSAAVYGRVAEFTEAPRCEAPLNVYGYSKLLFDQYVRRRLSAAGSQIAGLRYFNVYGPGEAHKDAMASVAWHFRCQLRDGGRVRLFEGSDGYADGEQRRDFVWVGDVARVVLWFIDNPGVSGIFNCGTGRSESFNEVARAVLGYHGEGAIEYVPFPPHLVGHYQAFTQADSRALRAAGCPVQFVDVATGVRRYMEALDQPPKLPVPPARA